MDEYEKRQRQIFDKYMPDNIKFGEQIARSVIDSVDKCKSASVNTKLNLVTATLGICIISTLRNIETNDKKLLLDHIYNFVSLNLDFDAGDSEVPIL